jgi:hypothetical protein
LFAPKLRRFLADSLTLLWNAGVDNRRRNG